MSSVDPESLDSPLVPFSLLYWFIFPCIVLSWAHKGIVSNPVTTFFELDVWEEKKELSL